MVTAVSGFIEQVGNMLTGIPKHKLKSINPLTIPLSFKASKSYHRHLSASVPMKVHRQLFSSELDNCQQMDAYELVFIG